jgi:hypothetical protein
MIDTKLGSIIQNNFNNFSFDIGKNDNTDLLTIETTVLHQNPLSSNFKSGIDS